MKKWYDRYVYLLKDPDTKEVRYVGVSHAPTLRLEQHMYYTGGVRRQAWMDGLIKRGLSPILVVLGGTDDRIRAYRIETKLILRYLARGCDILNTNKIPPAFRYPQE